MRIFFPILCVLLLISAPTKASEELLDIKKVTSPSGINAWLVEDHKLPIISIQFSFKGAGSVNLTEDKQGLSQLLSNTLDEGAGEYSSQEFQKKLSDKSISLSFNSGRDNFGGTLKFLAREKKSAVELLNLALNEPRFDKEPVQRMVDANINRIKSSQGNPNWINARLYNDRAYEGHPYAFNSGGTIISLQNITPQDLKDFKNSHLTKDRLVIGASGDITAEDLGVLIDTIFGSLPDTTPPSKIKQLTLQNLGKTYVYKRDIPQSIITIGLDSIDELHPDYYTLQILNHIFGASGFGSRLMSEAREKRGLTYGIYSSTTNNEYLDALTISTSTQNETVAEMLQIIKDEMKKIKTDDLTQDIKKAKDYIIGSLPLSFTNNDSIASILLSLQLRNRDINYLNQYHEKIMTVSAEDVSRLAEELLTPEKMITIITGTPKNLENTLLITEVPNVE